MNVLVLNAGSSSLKYQLMNTETREVYTKGNCEKIGLESSIFGHKEGGKKIEEPAVFPDHGAAVKKVMETLEASGFTMEAIGHRVVQGGWHFTDSALVDDDVLAKIYEVAPLAPLHNYVEAGVIEYCRKTYPELPNVAVFDTSFHLKGMPAMAYTYALPREVREKYHVRKYGAHGTSHRYEWKTAKEMLGNRCHRLLSCHLGAGSSLCAIEDGVCRDTTMGLTPLDGLIMGTRCGTIDPATVCYLQREGGFTADELDTMMNKKSGLLALYETTSDARDIREAAAAGDGKALFTLDTFAYRAMQQAGGMIATMAGVDTITFAGGIGENDWATRAAFCEFFEWLGVRVDIEKNKECVGGKGGVISAAGSSVTVCVVPTDEEYMISLDVERLVKGE